MAKNLTRRQKELLGQFLDFYQEADKPLHYVDLAKRLGLGKVTVYEMLRLLEKRGLVQSEFQLSPENRGPGRSTVLFRPTPKALDEFSRLSESFAETEAWEEIREQILLKLQEGDAEEYEDLLRELLIRIPEHRSPLIYITDMITAIILSIATISETAEESGLLDRLRRIGLPGEIGISALAGIGSALTMVENVNLKFSTFLFEQSGKYQEMLTQMSPEKRNQLNDFARQIMKYIKS